MADNKKSFVAYCDWQETFEELSDEEAGKLVKHLFNYVNDKNPETSDKLTKMCFIPIKQSLKRDLKKYENYIEKQSVNGKKGGRPKNPTLSEKTQPFIEKPKKADSVSVSVNDSVSEIIDKSITTKKAVDFNLNNNYKNNLLKDSYLLENFSRLFKTNIKTVLHYLDEFNTHLITTQEIKENQKEYQKHFSNWYNKKPRQTIKEQTRNLYKDLDKDL